MSDLSSGSASALSNSPPLNQATASKPTRPPKAITRKSSPASSLNCAGAVCAWRSIRVNMWSGSRPTSAANMQKTSRLTKCATVCGSWPRAQRLRHCRERSRRALGERLPGLSRPQPNRIRERPLEPPLPDVRPAVAARVLAGTPLEAVRLAGRVGLDRRRLAQQPAQVDEVLLRGRALLQLGGPHLVMNSCGVTRRRSLGDAGWQRTRHLS